MPTNVEELAQENAALRRVALVAEVILRTERELITPENNEALWAALETTVRAWRATNPRGFTLRNMSQLEHINEQASRALYDGPQGDDDETALAGH